MSAYIVEKHHITYLLAAAMSRRILPHGGNFSWYHAEQHHELPQGDYERACEVGNMLWRENIISVGTAYPNESSPILPGPSAEQFIIEQKDVGRLFETIDPVQVLKSCACYEYQSCEHDEWESSEAHSFIQSLRHQAIDALTGYESAVWGAPETPSRRGISLSKL